VRLTGRPYGRIDQVAKRRSQLRQDAILVRAGETAVADHVRTNDRSQFPGLAHRASPPAPRLAQTRDHSSPVQLTEVGPEPIARMVAIGRIPSLVSGGGDWHFDHCRRGPGYTRRQRHVHVSRSDASAAAP
jgi:hypothetical protein